MLITDTAYLNAELMDVVRLFGAEDAEIVHTFRRDGENYINTVRSGEECRTYTDVWQAEGELALRRCAKRSAKLALYLFLSELTGKTFPWGALTASGLPRWHMPSFQRGGTLLRCSESSASAKRISP